MAEEFRMAKNRYPFEEVAEPLAKKPCPMANRITLKFAKLTEKALIPTRGSKLAAGFDLYSAYDMIIPAKGKALVNTDIQITLPDGCYGRVAPRSGLARDHFIDVGAGVIDQDYRGNVGVVMFNFGDNEFEVKAGDRIAQLICERIFLPDLVEEKSLDDTERGDGSFGSTGKTRDLDCSD
ncbi:deoxyuridine 5'-triphosphate nucleotidohydrolase-like [Mya arenaria]|uniref:deoxyuridine 5'-triphosphate nucleotidohydrolase-like n=1 Tax=Mya arenaria TaxID=6604 RepID=UPI0022E0A062|nr:deoxyuridine 5'-triphosphate nucleotidohydrolase-like [Mya arenaria]